MIRLFSFLPLPWKLGLIAAIVIGLVGAVYTVKRSLYNSGYEACQEKYLEQLRKHNESVRSRLVSIEGEHQGNIDEIKKIGSDSHVGPAVTRAIDLMH